MTPYICIMNVGADEDGTPLYWFTRVMENGCYAPFDPLNEGEKEAAPVYPYDAIVQRFMSLAAVDPRVAVPPEIYNHYRAMAAMEEKPDEVN